MFPLPEIGFYTSECCELDLFKIETQDDLEQALERYADDECGPLMVFRTKEDADSYFIRSATAPTD